MVAKYRHPSNMHYPFGLQMSLQFGIALHMTVMPEWSMCSNYFYADYYFYADLSDLIATYLAYDGL